MISDKPVLILVKHRFYYEEVRRGHWELSRYKKPIKSWFTNRYKASKFKDELARSPMNFEELAVKKFSNTQWYVEYNCKCAPPCLREKGKDDK